MISDRARHERRLGLMLSAPAFVVMVLVTAYPLLYAVVLSLYNYRLTDPAGKEFVGLQQLRDRPDRPGVVDRLHHHRWSSPSSAWRSSWCSGSGSRS